MTVRELRAALFEVEDQDSQVVAVVQSPYGPVMAGSTDLQVETGDGVVRLVVEGRKP